MLYSPTVVRTTRGGSCDQANGHGLDYEVTDDLVENLETLNRRPGPVSQEDPLEPK